MPGTVLHYQIIRGCAFVLGGFCTEISGNGMYFLKTNSGIGAWDWDLQEILGMPRFGTISDLFLLSS